MPLGQTAASGQPGRGSNQDAAHAADRLQAAGGLLDAFENAVPGRRRPWAMSSGPPAGLS
ncbi:hypothetical protein [Streptomyces sp. H39-S7]|uniref:hypothetical protein n=1 Tax=Streptomyces sp. H39-S7 TaxID=3004357 RepID=UPI0022B01E63|nr:hypothetical protein [Streptomyces sp. H39-S7]MCZ4118250.1 hypothetical protein [Streptomyces sp. H39-S7]